NHDSHGSDRGAARLEEPYADGSHVNMIRRLSPEIANKIAAGEVVERPASLAKELIENALDAGARKIEIAFDGGGIERVRVADDGCGIQAEEVALAFERHATSKIESAADLENIATWGFRGEALASIAAVSRVELVTATRDALAGTRIRLEAGRVQDIESAARAPGTTIEVRSLFFNTPARRKFLKTPGTESRLVLRLAGQLALAALEVGFRIVREGKTALEVSPQASFRERLAALWGREIAARMTEASFENSEVRVSGLVSLGEFSRTRGEHQILLVNGRSVAEASLAHAVLAGLGGAAPAGKYPIFALALEIDPAAIDVNVHPAKREIRFARRDAVYSAIREAVGRAAGAARFHEAGRVFTMSRPRPAERAAPIHFGLPEGVPSTAHLVPETLRATIPQATLRFAPADLAAIPGTERRLRLAGELWGAYLLVEDEHRLLVIDQHAAHERVLYDEIRARRERAAKIPSQGLLVPLTIDLGPGQDPNEAARFLCEMGFDAREGGPGTVLVDGIPGTLSRWGGGDFLRDFFASPEAARASAAKLEDALAKSYACKGAVKFGQRLHTEEIERLLDALSRTEVPRFCPHGRPLYLELPRPTIDARFERT
ncbi:MAG TPA: DNA mismatch repair endonuclease MutL, partial [bacterium]|nr:DNA mismatch repair endonuclease MutL [bacterium]